MGYAMNLIPFPYRIAIVAALWLCSLAAVGWWQRHDGMATVEAKWQAREAKQQAAAAARYRTLYDAYRKAEQDNAAALAEIAIKLEKERTNATRQHAADIAALRTGALRLRDPGAAAVPACRGSAAEAGPASSGCNGGTTCELSGTPAGLLSNQASEFLVNLAADADDVARQLAACQQVIINDRK